MDQRRPVGLLGGSFDPIHVGHVRLARAAMQHLQLERVLFVPAGLAWQKGDATDASHRANMVALAIAGEPRWSLDRRELLRAGPSYTVDTLLELRQELGADRSLVLLMGSDQFERLQTWHQWERLTDLAHIGVAGRPGSPPVLAAPLARIREERLGSAGDVARAPAGRLVEIDMAPVECSSTQIRRQLHAGTAADALPMVAPEVLRYIVEHRLYS